MTIEHEYSRVIHHGGRTFFATSTMGAIFAAHADDTVARGDTELVPLLHRDGVEKLLIGPGTRFSMSRIVVGNAASAPPPPQQPADAVPAPVRARSPHRATLAG